MTRLPPAANRTAPTTRHASHACAKCGRSGAAIGLTSWVSIRPGVSRLISVQVPDWGDGQWICHDDLQVYRRQYVEGLLEQERGELSMLDRQVIDSLATHATVSQDTEDNAEQQMTFGDRMADRVASAGGSWAFILAFLTVLAAWIILNIVGVLPSAFDPYPFILLNLVLSCIAAIQAPVIMMSQRRQDMKDRLRNENDYRVNLKAELEIRQLHEKIDHQLAHQWERLAEMQQIQIELLEEASARRR